MTSSLFILITGFFSFGGIAVNSLMSNPDWLSYLLNGGPFAAIVLLIILDKLTTPGERNRLRTENKELRDEITVLNSKIREEVVPPLVQINQLMREVIEELAVNKSLIKNRHYER